MNDSARAGALDGLRVLDLSIWRPGPYATQLLAELGAGVLKIEPPGGDPMRAYPGLFASLNANKRSLVLDLHDAEDQQRALELAAEADVVIEGFRPGVVDRLGVGYQAVHQVNPSVVYCSISGLGQDGPLAAARGHDINFQAWAGVLAPDGGEPVWSPVPIADLASGTTAAFAIMAACYRRTTTGEGERLDVAMADVLATWTGAVDPHADQDPEPTPGYGVFPTGDGRYLTLGIVTEDHLWRALCEALDLPAIAGCTWAERQARAGELQGALIDALRHRDRDDLVASLLAAGVPVAPVHDRAEMLASPHFWARSTVTTDPWADPAMGYPVRFADHPAARTTPPPALDEHRGQGFHPRPAETPPVSTGPT